MSIDIATATDLVNSWLKKAGHEAGIELIILEEKTIEKEFYWVFIYGSKRFIEGKNPSHALAGNGPLIVDKLEGNVHPCGSAYDSTYYIQRFEKNKLPSIIQRHSDFLSSDKKQIK